MCFAVQLSMCSLLQLFATALIEYHLVLNASSTFFIFFAFFDTLSAFAPGPHTASALRSVQPHHMAGRMIDQVAVVQHGKQRASSHILQKGHACFCELKKMQ